MVKYKVCYILFLVNGTDVTELNRADLGLHEDAEKKSLCSSCILSFWLPKLWGFVVFQIAQQTCWEAGVVIFSICLEKQSRCDSLLKPLVPEIS